MATGRSDFANQVNNSLVFPGLFRGVLDVRARTITDDMALAVAHELAGYARGRGLHEDSVLPRMDEWEVYPRLAVAAGLKAQEQGVAVETKEATQLHANATKLIRAAQEATTLLMNAGIIPGVPETP